MLRGWIPYLAPFSVWFAHWAACWVASLIWQGQQTAVVMALVFTAIALLVLFWIFKRFQNASTGGDGLTEWSRHIGMMTSVFAAAATVFTVMPAVFLG